MSATVCNRDIRVCFAIGRTGRSRGLKGGANRRFVETGKSVGRSLASPVRLLSCRRFNDGEYVPSSSLGSVTNGRGSARLPEPILALSAPAQLLVDVKTAFAGKNETSVSVPGCELATSEAAAQGQATPGWGLRAGPGLFWGVPPGAIVKTTRQHRPSISSANRSSTPTLNLAPHSLFLGVFSSI